ncbi:MAG: hypothetical protein K6G01_07655 [Eubacterium sp.]|nr:hypothetical protein [Eubacterium sp.]
MLAQIKAFLLDEEGIGVVEVILILVVVIAMVAIFRDKIKKVISNVFVTINSNISKL